MHKDNKNHYNKAEIRFFLLFFFKKVVFPDKSYISHENNRSARHFSRDI